MHIHQKVYREENKSLPSFPKAIDTSFQWSKKSRHRLKICKDKSSSGIDGSSSTNSNTTENYQLNNARTTRHMKPPHLILLRHEGYSFQCFTSQNPVNYKKIRPCSENQKGYLIWSLKNGDEGECNKHCRKSKNDW